MVGLEKSSTTYNAGMVTPASSDNMAHHNGSDADITGFETDFAHLPKGYYRSTFFIGSMLATGISLWAGVGAFGYAAPVLGIINADLGPDPNYIWISLVYNVTLAIGLLLVGRLSDIFGRRYFFIGGQLIAAVGSVVCATAKDIPTLIGGNVLLGSATATQLSFHIVMGELVPMKWRYIGNAGLYIFCIPGSGFAPVISYAFIKQLPKVAWRGPYWLLLGVNLLALILWTAFYFPPNFHRKHRDDIDDKWYYVKHFDYVGLLLFIAGFVVFLLGLSWGGSVYPWKSAAVITAIVAGFAVLGIFVCWEIFAPLKEPVLPMHIFKSMRWVSATVLLGLGAGIYYAFAIIYPIQVAVLYGNGDLMYTGWLSCVIGLAIITGQVIGGILGEPIGKTRYQCMAVITLGGIFLASAAVVNPDNKITATALVIIGCMFIGWNETICLANATILVHDQREIGVAGGAAGSIRAAISAVSVAVYSAVLTNSLTENITTQVPKAVIQAGLPATSVADFLGAFLIGTPAAFEAVPGITAKILAVGTRAYKVANADAFRTVFLTTLAFTGIAMILTWFSPNTDDLMSGKVAATLGNEAEKHHEERVDHV